MGAAGGGHARFLKRLAWAALVATALAGAARLRARFLPDVEAPVLLYERVESAPVGKYSVGDDMFYSQLRELARQGYVSVSPARLRAYRDWGWPLPEKPVLITFDRPYKDLPAVAGQYLVDQGFTALVLLPTSLITNEAVKRRQTLDGVDIMTWEEVRAARAGGVFAFAGHTRGRADLTLSENPRNEIRASRADIKKNLGERTSAFSYPFGKFTPEIQAAAARAKIRFAMGYGDKVARIGPETDMLAVPRIRVVGGRQAFSAVAEESRSAGRFGAVRVTHSSGYVFPARISVFYGGNPRPAASADEPRFEEGGMVEVALPNPDGGDAGAMFPITVEVRDMTGVLLYHRVQIPRSSVAREAGTAVSLPGDFDLDGIALEPAPPSASAAE